MRGARRVEDRGGGSKSRLGGRESEVKRNVEYGWGVGTLFCEAHLLFAWDFTKCDRCDVGSPSRKMEKW